MVDSNGMSTTSCSHAEDDTSGVKSKEKNIGTLCQEKNPNKLKNYDDFRCKCKPLSHIKVRRESGNFHHFVVLAISKVSDRIDAVTIGHYIHPAEIGMESWDSIRKFVQQTFLIEDKNTQTHAILDFEHGVYLVKHENYPSSTKETEEVFNRLSERTGKYDILTDNSEHAVSCLLTRKSISAQEENTEISSKERDPNKLRSYDDFRLKCKPLSHIKVKRKSGDFHHFVVLAISKVTNVIDAVTIGEFTSSPVIALVTRKGIGKFVQKTYLMKKNDKDTHAILDFEKGVFLVDPEKTPSKRNEIEEAFNRLSERIGERKLVLISNNCEHAINQILTGQSVSHQIDPEAGSNTCFNDLFNKLIIDCKEVGLKTAMLVAALGAISGSLVRRAYVSVIVAAIVSLTVESSIIKCGDKRGSNLRNEASIRIDLAAHLPDINDAFKNTSSAILDDMKNHTDTKFVCNIAEKLIYEAAMTTCLVTIAIATGIETILFLSFVFNNLIPRIRKKTLEHKQLCRRLFIQLFAGYGSIGIAVGCGYFAFLDFNRPALSFFGIVFGCCLVFRYILSCTAGMIFNFCCFQCCWTCKCYEASCRCRCYKCYFSTACFIFLSSVVFLSVACLVVIVFWDD